MCWILQAKNCLNSFLGVHDLSAGSDGEFPVGYRFCPTDSELIVFYLKNKISNRPLPHDKIQDVKISDYKPDDLAKLYKPIEDREWYFFTPRDRKYPNGTRPCRSAVKGFWKATGADKHVYDKKDKSVVGIKKSLVFYEGKARNGTKTNWIMHEYRMNTKIAPHHVRQNSTDMKLDDWVLCRIHNKKKKQQAVKEEELFDDKDDDQQIVMNNDQPVVMNNEQQLVMNNDQPVVMNNDQQLVLNNGQQLVMNNDQQSVMYNNSGHSLVPLPQYVDYSNQMDYNYTMQLQEPIYEEINPAAEEHLFNYKDVSNDPFLMMIFNDQTILQNA